MQFNFDYSVLYFAPLTVIPSAFLYMYAEVRRLKRNVDRRQSKLEEEGRANSSLISALQDRFGESDKRTQELEDAVSSLSASRRSQAVAQGVDATQRTLVIRMARRGDRPEQIAAELRVPRNEVELLLKVQRALIARAS